VDAGTVLVIGDREHASLVGAFANGDVAVVLISPDPQGPGTDWARTCAEIARLSPASPLTIVAFGTAALQLPHVAIAQRSMHRRIGEYLLVRPNLPVVTDSWPDAPVTVYCDTSDETLIQARLRGWAVHPVEQLPDWRPAE
jgi:hypothetical protein